MFKDRLKDRARVAFAALLERHLVDREILVEDSAGNKLGRLREKIEYARPADLPDDVRAARRHGVDPLVQIAEEELRESIIHYEKEIELDARVLAERRHAGLTDILRLNVERLLHDMDEPEEEIEYVDRHTHGLTVLRAAKTYRVDAVVRLEDRPGRSQVTVYRMVLDRNGIKRMEKAK
jgi:hypothetical protein